VGESYRTTNRNRRHNTEKGRIRNGTDLWKFYIIIVNSLFKHFCRLGKVEVFGNDIRNKSYDAKFEILTVALLKT
jgi:hypothetical protein